MEGVYVHPHALKHGLSEKEILYAWSNFVKSQQRSTPREDQVVRIGYGREVSTAIQLIGVVKPWGTLIIHAMTPQQDSVKKELGILRR